MVSLLAQSKECCAMFKTREAQVREDAVIRTYVDICKRVNGSLEDTIAVVSEDLGYSPEAAAELITKIW